MVRIERWGFGEDTTPTSSVGRENWGFAPPPSAAPVNFNDPAFQYGIQEGWTTKDVSPGKYEIFDQTGKSLGFGYKSVVDTLGDFQKQNIMGSAREIVEDVTDTDSWLVATGRGGVYNPSTGKYEKRYWGSDYLYSPVIGGDGLAQNDKMALAQFKTKEEVEAELQKVYEAATKPQQLYGWDSWTSPTGEKFGGDLAAWEAIGNILAGKEAKPNQDYRFNFQTEENPGSRVIYDSVGNYFTPYGGDEYSETKSEFSPGASNQNQLSGKAYGLPRMYRGNMPATERTEEITGENTLFGSVPVFKDGKLVGYKIDTTVISPEEQQKFREIWGPKTERSNHDVGDNFATYNWNRRSSSTLNAVGREYNIGWGNVAKPLDDTGNVFVGKDDVSKIPGWKNKATASYENWAGGGFLEKVLPSLALSFIPGGWVVNAAMALDNKNPLGAVMSVVGGLNGGFGVSDASQLANQGLSVSQIANTVGSGGLLDYATAVAGKVSDTVGSTIGSIAKATGLPANVVSGALKGAIGGGVSGGKEGALVGGLIGGVSTGASNLVKGDLAKIATGTIVSNLMKMGYSKMQAEEMADKIKSAAPTNTSGSSGSTSSGTVARSIVPIERWGF